MALLKTDDIPALPPTPSAPSINPTLRAQLDSIDTWLCEKGGKALWDVLTALRGPDHGEGKVNGTEKIRTVAFPKCAANYEENGGIMLAATFARPTEGITVSKATIAQYASHFARHITLAASALNILAL